MNRRMLHVGLMVAIALAGSLCFVSGAVAGPKGGKSPFAPQLHELRAVRALLAQADHDYKGHRVAAIRQITMAIRTLRPASVVVKRGRGHAPRANKGELQSLSDAQLKQAIANLVGIQNQLKGMTGRRRFRQEFGQRVGVGQHADLAAKAAAIGAEIFVQPLGLPQDGARMLQQGAAGLGRRHALPGRA